MNWANLCSGRPEKERDMSGLEEILLSVQTEYSVNQGNNIYTEPTEFLTLHPGKRDSIIFKIYMYTYVSI